VETVVERKGQEGQPGILTQFCSAYEAVFHRNVLKKNINLLILHRISILWITVASASLSTGKNAQQVWITHLPRVDNGICKLFSKKFCTYPRPIILNHSIFLKKKKREN
jgi:hypothetical protein